ncbi:MAG: endolytic transglycosylase MltG, partial [Candidatus Staskawiczbacteria bacterium]|nr:endolytic transglycosylase MltG [Candidatus Staskawiczbacteria bacterium]
AEILAEELNWSEEQKNDWITKFTTMKFDYIEGVYFPDTYLIPKDENGLEIAQRFINKFNEEFAPYAKEFAAQNIKWTTALKIASLIQREAGSKDDMPLIAGIIWNRLLQGIKLGIDATLQYARGNTGNGWWAPITIADKKIDSLYNTYLYSGLPPHPICNPGINTIDAVLNFAETDCIYYLHDANKQIHCAKTYAEHLKNIEKYLK